MVAFETARKTNHIVNWEDRKKACYNVSIRENICNQQNNDDSTKSLHNQWNHTQNSISLLFFRYVLLFFVRSLFLDANSYPNETKCFLHILLLYDTRTAFQFTLFYFNRRSRYAQRADAARALFTLGARLNKQQCPPNIAIDRYTASILIQVNAMQYIHINNGAPSKRVQSLTPHWSIDQ